MPNRIWSNQIFYILREGPTIIHNNLYDNTTTLSCFSDNTRKQVVETKDPEKDH